MTLFSRFAERPLIMGVINVTPDSFSGDGVMQGPEYVAAAVMQAETMVQDGAQMLDIGGESSRPGALSISAEEEIRRAVPVIRAIRKNCGGKPLISIDTIKTEVAAAALEAGADIVNDITALSHDKALAPLIAERQCPVILMHNRSQQVERDTRIGGQYTAPDYGDAIADIKRDLMRSVDIARQAGISDDKIILDPGIGFGKNPEQNCALVKHVGEFRKLGFPVLLGPSRKSFIGKILDTPVEERLEGTAALVAIGAYLGADIIRVHDVRFMARVAKMASAVSQS